VFIFTSEKKFVEDILFDILLRRERNKRDTEEAEISLRQMALEDEANTKSVDNKNFFICSMSIECASISNLL
jgi:hypothetical protein